MVKDTKRPKDGPILNCPNCGGEGLFDGYSSEDPEGKIFIETRSCIECDYTWDNVFKFKHTVIDDHVPLDIDDLVRGMMGHQPGGAHNAR